MTTTRTDWRARDPDVIDKIRATITHAGPDGITDHRLRRATCPRCTAAAFVRMLATVLQDPCYEMDVDYTGYRPRCTYRTTDEC